MPTYSYSCPKCGEEFDDIKGINAYIEDPSSECPRCSHVCGREDRDWSQTNITFYGEKLTHAEYNPGLGCVVKNKAHKEDLMKQKGLVEVGNDFGSAEKQQNYYEKKKAEEKEKRWEDPHDFFL